MLVISGFDMPRFIQRCGCLHAHTYQWPSIGDGNLLSRGPVLISFIRELHWAQGLVFSVCFDALLTRVVLPQHSEVI